MLNWISPKILAKSTRKISTDFLKQNGLEIVSEWYHSPYGVDFFMWKNGNGEVIKFQLSVMGQVTEWSLNAPLQTGMILEEEAMAGGPLAYEASEKIQYDLEPQSSTLIYAHQILLGMSDLNATLQKTLTEGLESGGVSLSRRPQKGFLSYLKSLFPRK